MKTLETKFGIFNVKENIQDFKYTNYNKTLLTCDNFIYLNGYKYHISITLHENSEGIFLFDEVDSLKQDVPYKEKFTPFLTIYPIVQEVIEKYNKTISEENYKKAKKISLEEWKKLLKEEITKTLDILNNSNNIIENLNKTLDNIQKQMDK